MDVNAYSEGRLRGVQKNMNVDQTSKTNRFMDWFARKTQNVSSSLKPIRMGKKPEHKTSSSAKTRKSRKSVVQEFDEPMSWVPNREKTLSKSSVVSYKTPHSVLSSNIQENDVGVCRNIENAHGNVTLPLESPTNVGDLNRQRCKEKECDMMSLIPSDPTNCSYMGNLAINTFLHSYLTKTPDNRGWILDLSTGKSTVGIDMGKQNCEKIRKNLKKLIPYIKCDIVKKIHMILLYGHEFRKRHIPILYFLFKVFESVDEIHFGISEDFVLTDKIKDEFGKKGISIGIGKDGSGKRYLTVGSCT